MIDIYTDCSGWQDTIGISLFIIDNNDKETSFRFKTNTNLLREEFSSEKVEIADVGICELYAVYKAVIYVRKNKIKDKVRIFTDNMFVFLLLNKQCKIKKKYKSLFRIIFSRCFPQLRQRPRIEVLWIKGHAGVYGNEIANDIAQSVHTLV